MLAVIHFHTCKKNCFHLFSNFSALHFNKLLLIMLEAIAIQSRHPVFLYSHFFNVFVDFCSVMNNFQTTYGMFLCIFAPFISFLAIGTRKSTHKLMPGWKNLASTIYNSTRSFILPLGLFSSFPEALWGPTGASPTPANTSSHNEPKPSGKLYTLNLYCHGSLSFNNIYFLPHLSHIFILRRITYVSQLYQIIGPFLLHEPRSYRIGFFNWEKSL